MASKPVSGVSNVVSVAGGNYHSLALGADGKVFAWGSDAIDCGADGIYGQLGAGTLPFSPCGCTNIPIQTLIPTQSVIVAVAAGDYFSLALDTTGNVWAWGDNEDGQAGPSVPTGQCAATNLPTLVSGISNVIAIAAGSDHSIALRADKTVWTWGANFLGQLGRGNSGSYDAVPGQVNLSNVVAIAGGNRFSLAVTGDGQVYAWGYNATGQLGTNATDVTLTNRPMLVAGLSNAVLVAAPRTDDYATGGEHGMAMTLNQRTTGYWSWGDNTYGAVGSGSISGDGTNDSDQVYQSKPVSLQFCTRCQRCIQLSTAGSFTAQCNGTVYLYFNDDQLNFADSSGSYTVSFDGLSTNLTVLANNPAGVAAGIVTNGGVYTYTASGQCDRGGGNFTDADGSPSSDCSSINVTNSVCPMWKCFSLVGKIQ
jgi:alpha-tubulin suppressor-like RCC1 family protein